MIKPKIYPIKGTRKGGYTIAVPVDEAEKSDHRRCRCTGNPEPVYLVSEFQLKQIQCYDGLDFICQAIKTQRIKPGTLMYEVV